MKQSNLSRRIAFGGILSALSLLCMFLSGLFPFAEYTCPAAAGILLVALVIDFGRKTACIAYAAVAFLSFFITSNKEAAVLFLFFLGYYPILKSLLEQVSSRVLEWVLKLACFNLMIILAYWIIIRFLGLTDVLESIRLGGFEIAAQYAVYVLLALGNITFILYDMALSRLILVYCQILRPRLKRLIP